MSDIRERSEEYGPEHPYPGASQHDSFGLLTPEEIVAFKLEMANDRRIVEFASWIAAHLLTEIYEEDEASRRNPGDISYDSNVPQDPRDRLARASSLGAHWALGISALCELPEDEWIVDRAAPGRLVLWLEDMDASRLADASVD